MGVDVDIYRCRVGMFVHHGAGVKSDYNKLIKTLGSVCFVRMLLIMAGIEQNPGPDTFIFRYQYLLVEMGTKVLRELFVVLAGNDVGKFLAARREDILKLYAAKVITPAQKQMILSVNKPPSIDEFDMILLSCLLRNICGLSPPRCPVWRNPAPTDLSLESDIVRLRICRNELMHRSKLRLPETELKVKWKELTMILTRLNKRAGIPDLQKIIDDAERMDLHENMRNQYNETLTEWEYKDRIDDYRHGEIMSVVSNVEQTQGILQDLIKIYTSHLKSLPVSPLFEIDDEDLLHLYQSPTMHSIDRTKEVSEQIGRYEDLFCVNGMSCKQIYITGDAGSGKTSLCKQLCFLWCKAKGGGELGSDHMYTELWEDVDYISKFEYVFYISLRDTQHTHVLDMIIEQFFDSQEKYEVPIKSILRNKQCLVLMDGMDEWSPKKAGGENYKIPVKIFSESCVYIITSRPFGISNVRLSRPTDVDHTIQITGDSTKQFVEKYIKCMNKKESSDKEKTDFEGEIKTCGLEEQLLIPLVSSHLVALWFEKKLTDMPRAVIFANILEMMFKTAERKEVNFPPSSESTLQLPNILSDQKYLNKYVTILFKLCHLSFCSVLKQDIVMSLDLAREQSQSEPNCFSADEVDFLCKIGLLSKKVFGHDPDGKLKVRFIHKNFIDFFAALFISSFDSNNSFTDLTKRWKCLDDVLPCENLFPLLAGFSYDVVKQLFVTTFLKISDDLNLFRRNAIFHFDSYSYRNQILSLQNCVIKCFKEVCRSSTKAYEGEASKMEDFIFDKNSDNAILGELLSLNAQHVKSIHSVDGKYYPEFDAILCLQYLNIEVVSADVEKFTECMLRNESSLHTVGLEGCHESIPELPIERLSHLTSLSLSRVQMQHDSLCDLVTFLSDNIFIEHIKLFLVSCDNHQDDDSDCTLALNLAHHTKLTSLCLNEVNIICNKFANSSLKSFTFSEMIVSCYSDVFSCIKDSQLEYLYINFPPNYMPDYNTMKALKSTVNSLPCIKSLRLENTNLPGDVLLQLHPCVTQVEIEMINVTMSRQCFQSFIERCLLYSSEIKVELVRCIIASVGGVQLQKESMEYMSEYLESISTINITDKGNELLHFETTKFQ